MSPPAVVRTLLKEPLAPEEMCIHLWFFRHLGVVDRKLMTSISRPWAGTQSVRVFQFPSAFRPFPRLSHRFPSQNNTYPEVRNLSISDERLLRLLCLLQCRNGCDFFEPWRQFLGFRTPARGVAGSVLHVAWARLAHVPVPGQAFICLLPVHLKNCECTRPRSAFQDNSLEGGERCVTCSLGTWVSSPLRVIAMAMSKIG